MLQKCATCSLYLPQTSTCQIMIPQFAGKVHPTDYCSKHKQQDQIFTCEVCGQGMLDPIVEVIDGKVHIFCGNCFTTH